MELQTTTAPESTPVIEVPEHIVKSLAESARVLEDQQDNDTERTDAIAQGINDRRPEGIPSTLPSGEAKPSDRFLGASSVNSHSGIPFPAHTPSPEA